MRAIILVVALACAACDHPPREPRGPSNPLSPTTTTTPPASNGVDPRFDDLFWRQLIYDAYDRDGDVSPESIIQRPGRTRHFTIVTADMPPDLVARIEQTIPDLWRQVTGNPYTGEIHRDRDIGMPYGWTAISVADLRDVPACGRATLNSYDPDDYSKIELDLLNGRCTQPRTNFVHEFGHVLGLHHVAGFTAVMAPSNKGPQIAFQRPRAISRATRLRDRAVRKALLRVAVRAGVPMMDFPQHGIGERRRSDDAPRATH